MAKKRINPHKNFMVFNAVLFIAVMIVCGIFLYMAYTLKHNPNKKTVYEGEYHIEITGDFAGEDISIYINDSLLTKGILPDTTLTLDLQRFADDHSLMWVDNKTDGLQIFSLNKKGSKVILRKEKGEVVFEETPRGF